ncbi:MAG: TonB-dependent receptor, partial [Sphingomonas bacterium]|uniref:TonB-dependent receptor n=1 Tax=Sphingomonas bacterium TaxID=1895847 RepID=UPI00260C6FFC
MRYGTGFRLRLLLSGALLTTLASPAFAKGEPQPTQPTPDQPASADQPAGSQIPDIVVTATKRETNLQKTPVSISVLSTENLTDRHVQSLFNLADGSVPSLRIATFEARQSALTIGIRGIVPYDQNQTARDAGVGVYIDGVSIGKSQGLNAALFDIERIEVLKGPQGTLFGRNSEGGALSMVTKAPTGEFDGRVVAGVGNYGSRNAEIHLDLPSWQNISLKFDGVYQHQDPTVKDPLQGSTGWNYYDRKGGRVQARWQPFDGFTADVAYDYARDDNTPQYSQLLNYNPNGYAVGTYTNPTTGVVGTSLFHGGVACNTSNGAGGVNNACIAPKAPLVGVHPTAQTIADVGVPQQPSTDITHGVAVNLKYDVAPGLQLRSITAWRGVSTDQWDNSGGPERVTFVPNGQFSRYSLSFLRQHQFSQEFQAVGSIPQFDYVVGAYYYTEHATEYAATPSSNLWNADGTAYSIRSPIFNGTVNSGGNSSYQQFDPSCNNLLSTSTGSASDLDHQFTNSCQFISRASEAYDHNYSVFGNVTYTPAGFDRVHLTLGGRYTKDKRHGQLYVVNNNYVTVGGVSTFQPGFTPFTFTNNVDRFDPLVNLAFDASQDIHLYAKYATGFRAGGADDRSQKFDSFGPESVKSYEIGAKMDFLDHKVRLNLAGYLMDRRNTQFDFDLYDTDANSPTFNSHLEEAINAQGTNHIRGIEADLTVKPT